MELKLLDSFAAAFCVLGALHLDPPSSPVVKDFLSLSSQWPLPLTPQGEAALKELRSSFPNDPSEEEIYALWADQNRLYGITGSAQLSPFESVQRGDDGLVFDQETIEVRRYYGAMGLQAPCLGSEPDDHIGLEMDFLSKCLLKAADDFAAGNKAQAEQTLGVARQFSGEHLLSWGSAFFAEGAKLAKTPWLRGICILSGQTLSQWQQALLDAGYQLVIAPRQRQSSQEDASGAIPLELTRRPANNRT
ncbi:TorD/DmsD family molecular chaperone [Varibaculum vaginae]|uniref:TorD/DmsD family molecular chaperone n=1 Tax=Varibaculum vaginae TaxID=2364797 RepID=UPI000F081E4E|nr:molecular chaperone TorD family protein [Varibaculum vaginae]